MAIVPHAVRGKDGQIREIQTVEEAFGHPLEDIFVYAQTPLDPRGAGFSFKSSDGTHQEYIEGVLGKSWKELADNSRSQAENPGLVSLTQLHHVLFDLAIERLRKQGVLPSESHMPILSTDIRDISRGVLKHVNASEDTKRILGFSISPQEFIAEFLSLNPEAVETIYNAVTNLNNAEGARKAVMQHNERLTDDQKRVIFGLPDDIAHQIQQFAMKQLKMAFDPRSGILKKGKKIDPASYYPIMTSFFDVDIVSLHVQSWFFMQKVKRMQALLKHYKQTNPTIAVPEMDEWDITASMVHPTGIYYDLRAAETAAVSEIDLTGKSKSERNRMGPMIARIKAEHMARFYASLGNGGSGDSDAFKVVTEAVATEPILRWWASVIANLPDEL